MAMVLLVCLLVAPVAHAGQHPDEPTQYAIESVEASVSTTQAGAHPDLTTTLKLKQNSEGYPFAGTKNVSVGLPPGLIGDPTGFPTCPVAPFVASATFPNPPCATDTQVGVVNIGLNVGCENCDFVLPEPLYNLPATESSPARLGFIAVVVPVVINFKLRSDGDYGLTAEALGATDLFPVFSVQTITWGVPADPSHDSLRMTPNEASNCGFICEVPGGTRPSGLPPRPFMTNPTSCEPNQHVEFATTSYALPGQTFTALAPFPQMTGCERVPFEPTISLQPTTKSADSPSGLDVDLTQSQGGLNHTNTLAPADLRKTVVALPEGMTINPSAADGLDACSEAQIGLTSDNPIRFDTSAPSCPDGSKVGTAEINTPLLPAPLHGALYLADQNDNPFHTLLSGYLVAEGQGVIIKLAGRFDLNPTTGQIVATFDENPQQPFTDLKLHFNGGSRGVLTTPARCGTYASESQLTPWSGTAPVSVSSPFTIDQDCASGGFAPQLNAGVNNPAAGASPAFVFQLTRSDGQQNVAKIDATLPPGLLANLASVPLCPEALAASGNCPASSQVGSTTVGIGSGPTPVYVPQHGRAPTAVYLAGPYKGAPYSLVIRVPAQAGPFDLGVVTVRAGIYVDPTTAQASVKSDPLPQILQGIPLSYRDIRVTIDRPGFMLNPTSCEPMAIAATATSAGGLTAALSSRFQAGGCQALPFKPTFSATTEGNGNFHGASLDVKITQKPGEAAIHKVDTQLPLALPSRLVTLQKACTEGQFAADPRGCPAGSLVGTASASTPILSTPLTGRAYLVSHGSAAFPDLDIVLQGSGITIDLVGNTDIKKGITYSRFETVPDAPISSFELKLPGGPGAVLAATKNLCAPTTTVTVSKKVTKRVHGRLRRLTVRVKKSVPEALLMPTTITGQNGATVTQATKIGVTGCAKPRAKARKVRRPRKRHS
jgi:hypothetical protein